MAKIDVTPNACERLRAPHSRRWAVDNEQRQRITSLMRVSFEELGLTTASERKWFSE